MKDNELIISSLEIVLKQENLILIPSTKLKSMGCLYSETLTNHLLTFLIFLLNENVKVSGLKICYKSINHLLIDDRVYIS